MLNVRSIEKSYGDIAALRGVTLNVAAGSIVSLLGRNGAGKSTLLSIIAGLLKPDSGSVVIDGIDVLAQPKRLSGMVGIAPQYTGIYPPLTVRENLEFFGELAGMKRPARRARAGEVAEQLGLASLLDRRASKLSGGEARRLHTGCALVHRPKLLMLDEPTVGADVATRVQLIDAVKALAREGAAVVYTTHYLPEVESLDADIVIIDRGEVLASGSKRDLMNQHSLHGLQFEMLSALTDVVTSDLGAEALGDNRYRVLGDRDLRWLVDRLGAKSRELVSVETLKPDLESVFLAITGTDLAEVAS
jgi:ABC-2 type transport system ATP-binding protein